MEGILLLVGLFLFLYPPLMTVLLTGHYRGDLADLQRELDELKDAIKRGHRGQEEVSEVAQPVAPTPPGRAAALEPQAAPVYSAAAAAESVAPKHVVPAEQALEPTGASTTGTAVTEPLPSRLTSEEVAPKTIEPLQQAAGPHAEPPRWLVAARQWLLSGNLVAKVGLLILFVGVGFLLKYATDTYVIPVEVRLALVVLADLALLGWGWRIRTSRREVGLPVQGLAISILMLVTFAAYQRFELIPGMMAFGMLVVLTAFTCLLAVLQNAVWLASFGIAGGFAAPVMVATGEGNHIGLFSYYALLNAGVFAIGLMRSWRVVNLLGFAFTFIVGAAWGGLKYTPEHYTSAQLFLILFFLYYVALGLVCAKREPERLRQHVDAVLVLGTPLLAFGLQFGLVRHEKFGPAFSALALGLFYLGLAWFIRRRHAHRWGTLVEAYTALGVVFGTLALPMAFDGRWTSAAWALEGAGFVWLGLRQQQARTWVFGLLVQAGSWLSFIGAVSGITPDSAAEANLWLGFLLLAVSTFGIAVSFRHEQGRGDSNRFSWMANGFLALAGLWLLGGMWTEILLRNDGFRLGNLLVASAFVTAVLLNVLASKMDWEIARRHALIAQLAGGAALALVVSLEWAWFDLSDRTGDRPLIGALMICAGALFTSWSLQRSLTEQQDKKISVALLWWAGFWWFGPVLSILAQEAAPYLGAATLAPWTPWRQSYELFVLISAILFARATGRLNWPPLRWFSVPCWAMLAWSTIMLLETLYRFQMQPLAIAWVSYLALLAGSEYLLRYWHGHGWFAKPTWLRVLHTLRAAGPWLMIWPAGGMLVNDWLYGSEAQQMLMAEADWHISGSWARYLPVWCMLLVVSWLIRRTRSEGWPAAPIPEWYRRVLIPCAAGWALLLSVVWNLFQDGAMAPLPYLPLLNSLDLTTGFVVAICVDAYRMLRRDPGSAAKHEQLAALKFAGQVAAYVWLNLILLRSAAHYLGIGYRLDELAASQPVQAMLSLVWTGTALVLMRHAARRLVRQQWLVGAGLLGVVVAKLFLVDLSSSGSVARIVSFLGVGLLMLTIGYLAPFPKSNEGREPVGAPEPGA